MTSMMRGSLVAMVLLVWMPMNAAAPTGGVKGEILDSEGAAISNARVLIHWDPSGSEVGLVDNVGLKQDVNVVTDRNGNYSVTVPPGFYDVFVSAMSFTPTATKVRVKPGTIARYTAKMRADPLVSKELGDRITQ